MKRFTTILLTVLLFVSLIPCNAFATDIHSSDIEITQTQMETNARSFIERALKYAKENATESSPISVIVPSGQYELGGCLHIYSNTNLILQEDTVLVKTFEEGNMLKCGLKTEKNYGYDAYRNINVTGGVWDIAFNGDSCGMRFAHCKNVNIQNVTIKNNKNSHHIEIAAADNFSIVNCSFSGYERHNSGDGMAVQIDLMHSTYHFPDYYYYDDSPCKNITVKGCKFNNVYSGVGAYGGVVGSYFRNIVIRDNTFVNITDKAINAFNFIDSKIYNNRIQNATLGILYEFFPFEKLTSRFSMPNSSYSSTSLIYDSNTKIKNNRIIVSRNINRSLSTGIAVYGGALDAYQASAYRLKKGNYFVKNLVVSKNIVKVMNKVSTGMHLQYLYNSSINNNIVSSKVEKSGAGCNGIVLYHSRYNNITSNRINRFFNSISLQTDSRTNYFTSNSLKHAQQYGFDIDSTSNAKIFYGNIYKKNGKSKIHVREDNYRPYKKTVKNLAVKDGVITWKRFKKANGYIVYRSNKLNGKYEQIAKLKSKKSRKKKRKKKQKNIFKFTDTTAVKGKKYYYKVAAYQSNNGTLIYGKQSEALKVKYKKDKR